MTNSYLLALLLFPRHGVNAGVLWAIWTEEFLPAILSDSWWQGLLCDLNGCV